MKHILKCPNCGSYGLKELCSCGHARLEPKPPKYSPEDKYGHYRREAKKFLEEKEHA
ncbi:MAG: nucleolar RNA-binding Nop10p family protein [Candidatus Woesearchaeota archaeon]